MTCEACNDFGILYDDYVRDMPEEERLDILSSYGADGIARCDMCEKYPGDLEAGKALASMVPYGAWLIWAETHAGYLPSTEAPRMYLRNDPANTASVQYSVLAESLDRDGTPEWIVKVEFIGSEVTT